MISARRFLIAVLAWSAVALPGAAHADRETAERWFRAGERAYKAGQYVVAAEAFEKSYAELPLPAIAFSTAQAYRLQYFVDKDAAKLKRAIELYRAYIAEVKKDGRRDDAIASLAELEPILARVEDAGAVVAAPRTSSKTRLMIFSNVESATGTVDGDAAQSLPITTEVAPGSHEIAVSAEGYFPAKRAVTAVDGELVAVEINLEAKPARLAVDTEDGAVIEVDGRKVGQTPLAAPVEVPAGSHFVTVARRGREPFARAIDLDRGETLALSPSLQTTTQRKVAYAVLGTSAALFVGAGVTGFLAFSAQSDAADINDRRKAGTISPADLADYESLRADRDDYLTWTYALAGAGAAAGIAGALLFYIDTPQPESQPIVTPVVGPDTVGLSATF